MKFKREFPRQGGYYWYVDKVCPIPQIGFIRHGTLYKNGKTQVWNEFEKGTGKHVRIGDRIDYPHPQKNEIE